MQSRIILKYSMSLVRFTLPYNSIVTEFGEAVLIEQYAQRYRYRVPKGDTSVGYFFSLMDILKEKLDIDEYSASQTTLEQIFNRFARHGYNENDERRFTREILDNLGILRDGMNGKALKIKNMRFHIFKNT